MTVSYNIYERARISRKKIRQVLRLFALDLTASQITILTGLNRNTVNRYLTLIRRSIALHCDSKSPFTGKSGSGLLCCFYGLIGLQFRRYGEKA